MGNKSKFRRSEQQLEPGPSSGKGIRVDSTRVEQGASFGPLPVATGDEKLQLAEIKENPSLQSSDNFKERPLPSRDGDDSSHNKTSCLRRNQLKFGPADEIPARARANQLGSAGGKRFDHFMSKWSNLMRGGGKTLKGSLNLSSSSSSTFPAATSTGASREPAIRGAELKLASNEDKFVSENPRVLVNISTTSGASWRDESEQEAPPSRGLFVCSQAASGSKLPKQSLERRQDLQRASASRPKQRRYWFHLKSALSSSTSVLSSGTEQSAGSRPPAGPLSARKQQVEARSQSSCERASNPEASPAKSKRSQHSSPYRQMATLLFGGPSKGQQDLKQSGLAGSVEAEPARASSLDCNKSKRNKLMQFALARACNQGSTPDEQRPMEESKRRELEQPEADVVSSLDRRRVKGKVKNANGAHGGFGLFNNSINFVSPLFNRRPYKRRARAPPEIGPPDQAKRQPQWNNNSHANVESATDASDANVWPDGLAGNNKNLKSSLEASDKQLDCEGDLRELIDEDDKKISIQAIGNQATVVACRGRNRAADHDNIASYGLKFGSVRTEVVCHANEPQSLDGRRLKSGGTNDSKVNNNIIINNDSASQTNLEAQKSVQGADQRAATGSASPPNEIGAQQELVRRIENGRSKSNYASGDILDKQLAEGPRQGRVLIAIGASNQAAELGSGAGACGRANGAPQEAGLTALDPGWKMNDKNTDDLEANDGEADINRDDIDPAKPHLMLAPIQASCSAATTASNSSESNSLSHQNSSRLSFSSSSSSSSSSLSSSLANLNSLPSSSQCNSPLLDLRKLVQSGESAEVEERRQQQQPEARRRTKISIAIQEVDVTRGDKENQGSIQIQDENQRPKSQPETRIREGESNREEAQVGLNKKLVKRQQSVDSYRTARDLRNKMRRQQQSEKGVSSRLDGGQGNDDSDSKAPQGGVNKRPPGGLRQHRKYSMRPIEGYQVLADKSEVISTLIAAGQQKGQPLQQLKINIESSKEQSENQPETGDQEEEGGVERPAARKQAKPPNTLVLMPSAAVNSFVVGSFSGCITPTYPTHHLPSPKYVSPSLQQQQQMQYKKYSNASTISSSFGGGSESLAGYQSIASIAASGNSASQARGPGAVNSAGQAILPSDTESSIGAGSVTPSILFKNPQQSPMSNLITSALVCHNFDSASSKLEELAAAAKRALLAEHIYDNKCGLGEDMKFLASLPELCDITFLVGETREPVCAVKSVLAARSRVFHKILFGNQQRMMQRQAKLQQQDTLVASNEKDSSLRRDSSPRGNQNNIKLSLTSKTSSPIIGATNSISAVARPQSISPVNSAGKQWSVTTDYNGLSPTHISDRSAADQFKNSAAGNGGRISVTSAGHESLSQISQGSQQPLIIGPGQMAAPAPVSKKLSKKSSIRDKTRALQHQSNTLTGGRLSRMFTKRASDPSIKQQQQQQQILLASNQNYLDKMSRSQMSTTMIIEEFEPDVFRQLIEYIHTGCVMLQARTLLGLLNAADYYGLEQLRKACLRFVTCCITVDTVCSLLSTAERYIQYKCTKSIVQKVLEFVDSHADEIFKLNAFGLLPEHVVRLILSRDGLKADEHVKYNGVYTWCEHYCRSYELTNISDVMRNFLDLIQFHKIPTNVLLSEIYPTHIVPDNLFLSALAYQAEPQDDEIAPNERARRMTLPNPTISKRFDDEADDEDTAEVPEEDPVEKAEGALGSAPMRAMKGERQGKVLRESTGRSASSAQASSREPRRVSGGSNSNFATGQHQQPQQHSLLKNRKSTGEFGASLVQKASKLRKGSIAQASINGMMKLSHKLSIKKRHTHSTMQTKSVLVGHVSTPEQINFGRPRGSSVVLAYTGGRSSQQAVERQESNSELIERGKQILDAWQREMEQKAEEAEEERKRKLEEESAKRRSMEQATANSSSIEASQDPTSSSSSNSAALRSGPRLTGTGKQGQSGGKSSRASMKDFKNISKIFMRKPSSKLIRQQASATSEQSGDMTKSLSKKLQRTKIQESTNDGSQPIP